MTYCWASLLRVDTEDRAASDKRKVENHNEHLLNTCYVPDSVLRASDILILLILTMTLQEKYYHLFIDKANEAQRG